jgi:tRNA C32,U32 (ribose-2'-O)-methylase TrmJ
MNDPGFVIKRLGAVEGSSADAEETLMDGYACALELEAERIRLERAFAELAHASAENHDSEGLRKLRALRLRITSTEEELAGLREVLSSVRQRFVAAGATGERAAS